MGSKKNSLDKIISTIDSFANLEKNWNSYDADPPTKEARELVKDVAREIYEKTKLIPYHTSPGPNGEIMLEYSSKKQEEWEDDLEVEIMENGKYIDTFVSENKAYDNLSFNEFKEDMEKYLFLK